MENVSRFFEKYGASLNRKCSTKIQKCVKEERKKTKNQTALTINAEEDTTLRKYQQQAINDIMNAWKKMRSVMLQMPTGTGKTRLFVSLINSIYKNTREKTRILIVTHREELVGQISETLSEHYNIRHGILQGGNTQDTDREIIVASIQSLTAYWRKNTHPIYFSYIIIDEAHHSIAKSYTALWKKFPEAYKLGVTATPCRMGRDNFTAHYQHLIKSQPIKYFIKNGYLADYSFYTISHKQASVQKINRLTKMNVGGDYQIADLQRILANKDEIRFLYQCYKTYCQDKRGIIYAVNRLHAEMIANHFAKNGVTIECIDSKTAPTRRRELIEGFKRGEPEVLVNVELFGEGFDCPAIEFAMLTRPTKSLTVYLQQAGRALRPWEQHQDKSSETTNNAQGTAIILDCAGMYNRFGLPEDERNWDRLFNGNKLSTDIYDAPLGIEAESEGIIEIKKGRTYNNEPEKDETIKTFEIFRRNNLYGIRFHNGIEVTSPIYTEIEVTKDGWFYGRTTRNELVIFDKKGELVFKMRNCELKIHNDDTFNIIATSTKGKQYDLGKFNKNMYIQATDITEKQFNGYTYYLQKAQQIIMLKKRLSMDNMFLKNVYLTNNKGIHTFLIDLFGNVYKKEYGYLLLNQTIKPTNIPIAELKKTLIDSINN